MTARSAVTSGAVVDEAAIAAAVAGALSIPTTGEIATAVGAQAACAAAITAAGIPAATATAVGAQTACAAAITAASLATAGDMSTLQTAVNLLPVDADVTTLVGAVVDSKLADIGAAVALAVPDVGDIEALLSPAGTGPFKAGPLTGSLSYTILAAVPGQVHTVYGYEISTDVKGVTATLLSGATAISAGAGIPNGDTHVLSPGSRKSFVCGTNEALVLTVTDITAVVYVTYWSRTAAP